MIAITLTASQRAINSFSSQCILLAPLPVLGEAVALAPTQPIFSDATHYFQWPSTLGTNNPVADLRQIQDQGTTLRSIGNVEGEYIRRWGGTLTYDWPRFFVRVARDPNTNFTTVDSWRLSVGTRF